jgi:hypothetical protein
MANTVSVMATVDEDPLMKGQVKQNKLIFDTANTDLVVHTPATGWSVYLKGLFGSETSATNLTLKQRSASLTGTVATTNGSPTITGTGTAFLTDYANLPPGTQIVIDAAGTPQVLTIQTVTNDTSITATGNSGSTVSGKTHARQELFITPELAANQGMLVPVKSKSWILGTKASYALVASYSDVTGTPQVLVSTQEGQIN